MVYMTYYIHFEITWDPCHLIGSHSQIAPFYALNGIFLPANETALLKNNNQSNFKAFLKKSIKLQENERQLCNFLQTTSV